MNNGRYNSEDTGNEAGLDIPAVAYVRMSTDHQKYSTENQLDIIRNYATARGLQILRVFEDSGRSGLRLDGREALQNLMAEVRTGQADFKAILVYDVSRWGRFQDADEGAYHEHVCSRAGIRVHYCGEQFENDGSIGSNLLKTVKRVMAGEYSRELSVKVFAGQCRLVELGYRQGAGASCPHQDHQLPALEARLHRRGHRGPGRTRPVDGLGAPADPEGRRDRDGRHRLSPRLLLARSLGARADTGSDRGHYRPLAGRRGAVLLHPTRLRSEGVREMTTVTVYDPAMCCSTGICGTDVD